MIDKEKLLTHLKQKLLQYREAMKNYFQDSDIYKGYEAVAEECEETINEIESGTFDIKEDTDHADRG